MPEINVVVKHKLSGEEFDVDVSDTVKVSELAEKLRAELDLPAANEGAPLVYKLVDAKTGLMLADQKTLSEQGIISGTLLAFWGEPTPAARRRVGRLQSDPSTQRSRSATKAVSPRLGRLQREYQLVLDRFGKHPHVRVKYSGDPPEVYTVTYNIRAPVAFQNGELQFGSTHQAQITLLADYPLSPPSCEMLTPVFHPNISQTTICIGDSFAFSVHVADIIEKIGNMLQYRDYDLRVPFQNDATKWAESQREPGPFDSVPLGEGSRQ